MAVRAGVGHVVIVLRPEVLGEPPVHDNRLAELTDDNVRGLEISVYDTLVVRISDGLSNGEDDPHGRQPIGERAFLLYDLSERAALDELHGIEGLARGPATSLVDRNDTGMLKPRGDRDLANEAPPRSRIVAEALIHRDDPTEASIKRAVHASQTAASFLSLDLIRVERDLAQRGHRRRAASSRRGLLPRHTDLAVGWLQSRGPRHCLAEARVGEPR